MLLLIRIGFWSTVLLALVMAVLPQPPAVPAPDKAQHMLAFFTLAVLGSAAYPAISPARFAALLAVFGGLIELVQMIPALQREGSVLDWAADFVAAVTGVLIVGWWRRFAGAGRAPDND